MATSAASSPPSSSSTTPRSQCSPGTPSLTQARSQVQPARELQDHLADRQRTRTLAVPAADQRSRHHHPHGGHPVRHLHHQAQVARGCGHLRADEPGCVAEGAVGPGPAQEGVLPVCSGPPALYRQIRNHKEGGLGRTLRLAELRICAEAGRGLQLGVPQVVHPRPLHGEGLQRRLPVYLRHSSWVLI